MPRLTDYTGTAELGLGSSPQIPVSTTKDLTAIQQAGRDAMIIVVENQRKLFDQKVKDHEELLKLLSDGSYKVNDHLAQDLPILEKGWDEMKAAWLELGEKGFNNNKAFSKYKNAKREADLNNVQAQARFIANSKYDADIAAANTEEKRNAIRAKKEKYLNNFNSDYDPYVEAITLDHPALDTFIKEGALIQKGGVMSDAQLAQHKLTTKTTTGKDGKQVTQIINTVTNKPATQKEIDAARRTSEGGLSLYDTIPGKYYDYNKMLTNAADATHDPRMRDQMRIFVDDFLLKDIKPVNLKIILDDANRRYKQYNEQRGFSVGYEGYLHPLDIIQDPNTKAKSFIENVTDKEGNKSQRLLRTEEAAARMALAGISGDYVEKDQKVFNKDVAAHLIAKQKADADELYKKLMAGAAGTKARAYADNIRQQMKFRKTEQEQDDFLNEMYKRNLLQQPSLIGGVGSSYSPIKSENSLPIFTIEGNMVKQLQPIGATPKYADDAYDASNVLKPGAKPLYYEGGHFEPIYQLDGKNISKDQMAFDYSVFKNRYKGDNGEKWKGSFDDYLKEAVNKGLYMVMLKGANGTVDEDLSRAAQRIISNTRTKKGQTEIFEDIPLDEQIPDQQ